LGIFKISFYENFIHLGLNLVKSFLNPLQTQKYNKKKMELGQDEKATHTFYMDRL